MSDTDLTLERVLNAPRAMVWKALTTPELMKQWWAPRPFETPEVEIDLKPGGIFYNRMVGPDFEHKGSGCVLEVIEGEKFVWTSALGPGFRPNDFGDADDCTRFAFTAVITLEDDGDKTLYRVLALHKNAKDKDAHAEMGFEHGWGICADQLGEVAAGLSADA
jgi:uncharacterized protein YndB with AHSA1/START domain